MELNSLRELEIQVLQAENGLHESCGPQTLMFAAQVRHSGET